MQEPQIGVFKIRRDLDCIRCRGFIAHHAHLLVHGLLHLQGHDHEREDEAARMERRERAILARLGFPDPYAGR